MTKYIVSIDELEERTGIDFFPMPRNNSENQMEGTVYQDVWDAA